MKEKQFTFSLLHYLPARKDRWLNNRKDGLQEDQTRNGILRLQNHQEELHRMKPT